MALGAAHPSARGIPARRVPAGGFSSSKSWVGKHASLPALLKAVGGVQTALWFDEERGDFRVCTADARFHLDDGTLDLRRAQGVEKIDAECGDLRH